MKEREGKKREEKERKRSGKKILMLFHRIQLSTLLLPVSYFLPLFLSFLFLSHFLCEKIWRNEERERKKNIGCGSRWSAFYDCFFNVTWEGGIYYLEGEVISFSPFFLFLFLGESQLEKNLLFLVEKFSVFESFRFTWNRDSYSFPVLTHFWFWF